jgi:LytS/YehU family sensor histidine kinase
MNPHFLFNALDAISNFIFKNQPKDAVRYMGKLAKLMRLTLDSSRSDSMVVADEVELLQQYLDLCILRYGDFETKIEVCEGLDPYDEVVPPMLIQPLVENAVQHAVRPLLSAQKPAFVHIQFSLDETAVVVKVRDNGKGYDAKSVRSESHGLEIIKERLELLSKKHGRPFELNVKSPWDHSSSGTEVSLILNMESNG